MATSIEVKDQNSTPYPDGVRIMTRAQFQTGLTRTLLIAPFKPNYAFLQAIKDAEIGHRETRLISSLELVRDDPMGLGEASGIYLDKDSAVVCQKRGPSTANSNDPAHHPQDTVGIYVKRAGSWVTFDDVRKFLPFSDRRLSDPTLVQMGQTVGMIAEAHNLADGIGKPTPKASWPNSGIWFFTDLQTGDPTRIKAVNVTAAAEKSLYDPIINAFPFLDFAQPAVNPVNPNEITLTYLVTGNDGQYSLGLQVSRDKGRSWLEGSILSDENGKPMKYFFDPKPFYFADGNLGVIYQNYADGFLYVAKMDSGNKFKATPVIQRAELKNYNIPDVTIVQNETILTPGSNSTATLPVGTVMIVDLPEGGENDSQPQIFASKDNGMTYQLLGTIRLPEGAIASHPKFQDVEGYGPVLTFYRFNPQKKEVDYVGFDLTTGKFLELSDKVSLAITADQFKAHNQQPIKRLFGDYNYGAFNLPNLDGTNRLQILNLAAKTRFHGLGRNTD